MKGIKGYLSLQKSGSPPSPAVGHGKQKVLGAAVASAANAGPINDLGMVESTFYSCCLYVSEEFIERTESSMPFITRYIRKKYPQLIPDAFQWSFLRKTSILSKIQKKTR